MRKITSATNATSEKAAGEHHLVTELRAAMASKDIVTMGRMLELLGTIQAELVAGKPVINTLAVSKTDPSDGSAPSKTAQPRATPASVRSLSARLARQ